MSSFWTLKKCVRPGYLNQPKCTGFSCCLNPASSEFLTIDACSNDMCFAPANFGSTHLIILILYIILAHQGAAICMRYIYILFNECLLCLLSLSISRSHTLMCKGRTSYKIRYLSVSSGSVEHQILNSWVDFPKWVKGLKYCTSYIWLKCFNWNILHSTYDKIFLDFYINCSLLLEWPARLNPSSWVLNIFNKRQKTHLFHHHLIL